MFIVSTRKVSATHGSLGSFIPLFSAFTKHLPYAGQVVGVGEQNWTWFCKSKDRLTSFSSTPWSFHDLTYTYCLPGQVFSHLLSLSSNDHHSFHSPKLHSLWLMGGTPTCKQGGDCPSLSRLPRRDGLTLWALKSDLGKWPDCPVLGFTYVLRWRAWAPVGGVINIHPSSPTAVSSPTHLHFLFLWLIFLAVK